MNSDQTPQDQPNNPLHGVKLATIVEELVEHYGWEDLSLEVNINCFKSNPSVKSSLKFLRRTPWARDEVEALYIQLKKTDWRSKLVKVKQKENQ